MVFCIGMFGWVYLVVGYVVVGNKDGGSELIMWFGNFGIFVDMIF